MPSSSSSRSPQPAWGIYSLYCFAFIVLALLVKVIAAWAAEAFLYVVPFIGGMLKSLELMELSNILAFAILGMGLGSASRYLPSQGRTWQRALLLVVAVPLVYFASYATRQQFWVNQVAVEADLSRPEARELTSQFLQREAGDPGFWGFYRLTTQVPVLPTDPQELDKLSDDEKWFRSELTRFSGVEPGIFLRLFGGVGWGIRLVYGILSLLTVGIYFNKGVRLAQAPRQPAPPPRRRPQIQPK